MEENFNPVARTRANYYTPGLSLIHIYLRDSGSIEQDADCVLFLYRDSYYASQNPDGAEVDADTAECIVAKNRHGETSTVPLGWDGAHTRFMDVDFKR